MIISAADWLSLYLKLQRCRLVWVLDFNILALVPYIIVSYHRWSAIFVFIRVLASTTTLEVLKFLPILQDYLF